MTKRALKKLQNLERKFTGPNAGLVWGIWPLWFVGVDHPFHLAGVCHDIEYLLKDIPYHALHYEIITRLSGRNKEFCVHILCTRKVGENGYQIKARSQVDRELRNHMLQDAGNDKKLILTAHIAYRVVRALGWIWW